MNYFLSKIYAVIAFSIVSVITIAQPAHYYDSAIGKSCASLKTALKKITTNGNSPKSYSALWNQYALTDIKPRTVGSGSTNVIYDIYSANPGGTDPYQFTPGPVTSGGQQDNGTLGTAEGQLYNKEHSVPKSWFNGNTSNNGVATDYLFVIPTDKYVNGKRGEMPYAEVLNASNTFMNGTKIGSSAIAGITGDAISNKVFEPIDSFKGDVARSFFYFITRYEDDMSTWPANATAVQAFGYNTYPSVTIPFLKMMLRWHHLDPVSSKEKTRNDGAYSFQGNRNPFVDHPEYVDSVWNANCPGLAILPVDILYFTGKINGNDLVLNWEVDAEMNLSHYEVERSFNGTNYTNLTAVNAVGLRNYSLNEPTENIRGRRVFYRIKKVDRNGKFSYSEIFSIHLPLNNKFTIYPNPARNNFTLKLNNNYNYSLPLQVTDLAGKVLINKNVMTTNGAVNVSSNLSNGVYLVKLVINGETLTSKLIVER